MFKKKGQITIFITLGIIIIIAISILIYTKSVVEKREVEVELRTQMNFQSEIDALNNYIVSCLDETALNAINIVGLNETMISDYIKSNLSDCINFSYFQERGLNISVQMNGATAKISDYDISISLDYPVEVKKETQSVKIKDFFSEISLTNKRGIATDKDGNVTQKITIANGNAVLVIPKGTKALDINGNPLNSISMRIVENTIPIIGFFKYDFEPKGATFDPPITLTTAYQNSDLAPGTHEQEIEIKYYDENQSEWVPLPSNVDAVNNRIISRINHFSDFGPGISPEGMARQRQVFIVSDKDWELVFQLIPLVIWTDKNRIIHKDPILILHEERGSKTNLTSKSFDADSIIHFLNQYNTEKVTLVGKTPQEFDNLLTAPKEHGAGLTKSQIQRVDPAKYTFVEYWSSYGHIGYVEDDYELAMMASVAASFINAPLIIKGGVFDNPLKFINKTVYLVGNVSCPIKANCIGPFDLKGLQRAYVGLTNTTKIILVNPNDLNMKVDGRFQPDKSGNPINDLYSKTSLAAPILASGKHEIIISTTLSKYQDVDNFIESKINELGLNAEYLTIMATPDSIPNTFTGILEKNKNYSWYSDADSFFYSDINNDTYGDLAVGRIYGLTAADVSSYLSRDLFYAQIPNSDNYFSYHRSMAQGFGIPGEELSNINLFKAAGFTFDNAGIITYFSTYPAPNKILNNKSVIEFWTHGGQDGIVGLTTSDIIKNRLWLNPSLVIANACLTCAYNSPELYNTTPEAKTKLFCVHMLRRGALAYIGALDVSNFNIAKPIINHLFLGKTVGQAFRDAKNDLYTTSLGRLEYWRLGDMSALFGDPAFDFNFSYPNNTQRVSSNNYINAKNQLVVEISIPKINKVKDPNPKVIYNYFEAPIGREATSIIDYIILNGRGSKYYLYESYTFDPIELGAYKIDKINHLSIEGVDTAMVPTAPSNDFLEKLSEISGLGKTITEEMNKEVMNAVYPGVSPDGIVYHEVGWIKDPDNNKYHILFTREKGLQLNEIELPESIPAKTYKIYFDLIK